MVPRIRTYAAAAAVAAVIACTSRNPSTPSTPAPGCTSLAVDPGSATVDASGGDRTIAVTANSECNWTAAVSSGADAVTITDGASGRGNGSIKINVKVNAGAERRATITVGSATVALTQQAAVPCTFAVDPVSLPFRSSGGTATVAVSAQGTACTWAAATSDSFITINSGLQGTGSGTVAITVAANSGAFRSGTLTVAGRPVSVTQDAAGVCVVSLTPPSQTIENAAYSGTIAVAAPDTCGWQVASRASFIEITGATRGNGNGVVSFRVAANDGGGVQRSGGISIGGLEFNLIQRAGMLRAVYDSTLKAPVCNSIGAGCDSGSLLEGSGTTEQNQPNTVFSSCPDGAGNGHFAVVRSISVSSADGSTMAVGSRIHVFASLGKGSTADFFRVYYAADALHPSWILVGESQFDASVPGYPIILAPGELQVIRVSYAFGRNFGNACAVGSDDDNDDLVFRVQQD